MNIFLERINFNSSKTGLTNIVIWISKTDERHGPRIKVSNVYNKMVNDDTFTITLPDKKIIGINKLSRNDIQNIFAFIDLNLDILTDFNLMRIPFDDFLDKIKKL